uniref:Uncharacterized protein n=1 Tax=Setaria digitata TaxID=48799 RepID=A0A915Q0W9_9BILA
MNWKLKRQQRNLVVAKVLIAELEKEKNDRRMEWTVSMGWLCDPRHSVRSTYMHACCMLHAVQDATCMRMYVSDILIC